MSDERTRTREIVEAQTVEEEEYLCPHCQQWYDPDLIVPVGINLDEDATDPTAVDQLCTTCAENIFGYEGPEGAVTAVREEIQRWTWQEFIALGFIGAVMFGVLGFLLRGISAVLRAVSSSPSASGDSSLFVLVANTMVDLAPLILTLGIAFSTISMIVSRGGRL